MTIKSITCIKCQLVISRLPIPVLLIVNLDLLLAILLNTLLLLDLVRVLVVEQVDNHVTPLVVGLLDLSLQGQDLSGQHPEHHRYAEGAGVVARDDDVDELEVVVGVAQSDDWDVGVGGLLDGLEVGVGVGHDDDLGLLELFGLMVGQRAGGPSGGRGDGAAGVLGELDDGSLSVVPGGDGEDFGEVSDAGDDAGGESDLLVCLVDVEDGHSLFVDVVDVSLHLDIVVGGGNVTLRL